MAAARIMSTSVDATRAELADALGIGGGRQWLRTWESVLGNHDRAPEEGWSRVQVPHNWEDYHGYARKSHGNQHGTAWYRRRWRVVPIEGSEVFLQFEGVGSYADVWMNGIHLGSHAGGRTSFTLRVTPALDAGGEQEVLVRAHHPEKIRDLPFVCGGCWGTPTSEGSQPFGISRPVSAYRTGPAWLIPFGLYPWVEQLEADRARVRVRAEVASAPDTMCGTVRLHWKLIHPDGRCVADGLIDSPGEAASWTPEWELDLADPVLWGPDRPHLYNLEVELRGAGDTLYARDHAPLGIRRFEWPEIVDANGKREVRSPSRNGRILHSGREPISAANGGFTRITHRPPHSCLDLDGADAITLRRVECDGERFVLGCNIRLRAHSNRARKLSLRGEVRNDAGTVFLHHFFDEARLQSGNQIVRFDWTTPPLYFINRWQEYDPAVFVISVDVSDADSSELLLRSETRFGFIDTDEPLNLGHPLYDHDEVSPSAPPSGILRCNGTAFFINGGAEYETRLGQDHAFDTAEVEARVAAFRAAGFNAFRDAHHPHNLRYYEALDRIGMPCWTQLSTHLYFDDPAFRANCRQLVREWVRERRSHPCILIWGLQNESALPEAFAAELTRLIEELDPTTGRDRIVTTCNGGKGTHWNVPQEWCGTYGGNCADYDLQALQMVGEYGAWRLFGVHVDTDYRGDENDRSEEWACHAMETKIRLAERARTAAIGHWHWIFNTFPNPGRSPEVTEGPGEYAIGPVNNKGLVTAWGQPSDLFYLYRANFVPAEREPMVYIVSPTWRDRWKEPGRRDNIRVYSNCEEVELFNAVGSCTLGVKRQPGRGRHFRWDGVDIRHNTLYAEGRVGGVTVARHIVVLDHLPEAPGLQALTAPSLDLNRPLDRGRCLYRINCGAHAAYRDQYGNEWVPDTQRIPGFRLHTWADEFAHLPRNLASRDVDPRPVAGAGSDGALWQSYRYGRHRLHFEFDAPAGAYRIQFFTTEPWFGDGGSLDCKGWRLFDIAVNDHVAARDVDVWAQSGYRGAHRIDLDVNHCGGALRLHFPHVAAAQAVVCAIAVYAI